MNSNQKKVLIFTETHLRDGIGIEYYLGQKLIVEIFRNDEKSKTEVTLFEKEVSLEILEDAIKDYKKAIT